MEVSVPREERRNRRRGGVITGSPQMIWCCSPTAMKRFIDLLNEQYKLPSKEQPEWTAAQLEALLAESLLHQWRLGDPIPEAGRRILVGIARWSRYDLKLLDALNRSCHNNHGGHERIDIFDIDAAARSTGNWDFLTEVIPGIGKIYQTPTVGIWEDGVLVQKGSGAAGRDLLIDRYGLDREDILGKR